MGKDYKIARMIPVGSSLVCADNSGAKKLQVIGYIGQQGALKRRLSGGVGSIAVVTVKKGAIQLLSKVHYALIVRQKYAYTRKSGPYLGKVRFEDNAAILLDADKKPRKAVIKGVIAKQIEQNKKYSGLNAIYR